MMAFDYHTFDLQQIARTKEIKSMWTVSLYGIYDFQLIRKAHAYAITFLPRVDRLHRHNSASFAIQSETGIECLLVFYIPERYSCHLAT
jgi:hypothetical protein